MRKILFITLEFPPMRGGVAAYVKHCARELGGEVITILTPPAPGNTAEIFDRNEPYSIIRAPLLFPWFIWPRWVRTFIPVLSLLKKTRSALLATSHVLPLGYILLAFYHIKKIPYWINLHGLDLLMAERSAWKRFWLNKILFSAERIVANSAFTRQMLLEKELVPEEKITVVYPCPDEIIAVSKNQLDNFRSRFALEGKKIILSLGRLVRRKGFDRVIEALPAVLAKFPSAVYVIAGEGEEMKRLEALVIEKKLQNSVRLLGGVKDEERAILYSLADIFIMPTVKDALDVEGFGIVYLEASAYGVPVIATAHGGAREAVVHGIGGLIIEDATPPLIAETLTTLLGNPLFAKKLGENGSARVKSEFIWRDQVARLKPFLT